MLEDGCRDSREWIIKGRKKSKEQDVIKKSNGLHVYSLRCVQMFQTARIAYKKGPTRTEYKSAMVSIRDFSLQNSETIIQLGK